MSIIIGIDHGYYAIKTAHCSFPAGLTSGRQPIQRDKTMNDNYYLLTLAAVAKEIQQRSLPPECSVRIAAGLPLTSFGRDKPRFKEYLLRSNQPVNYKFEGVEYSITVEEVAIFPQGYRQNRQRNQAAHQGRSSKGKPIRPGIMLYAFPTRIGIMARRCIGNTSLLIWIFTITPSIYKTNMP